MSRRFGSLTLRATRRIVSVPCRRKLFPHGGSTRSFSSKEGLNEYLYPTHDEIPTVTTTQANDEKNHKVPPKEEATAPKNEEDPFDDALNMDQWERQQVLEQQRKHISTDLSQPEKIEEKPPAWLPPNVSQTELKVPEVQLSTLPNGLRVVSQEILGGPVATVGLLCNVGSRLEKLTGIAHLLATSAFRTGTPSYPNPTHLQEELQRLGATHFCHADREQTLWCVDALRPNLKPCFELLKEVVLTKPPPPNDPALAEILMGMHYMITDLPPEAILADALQVAAYGEFQQLGKRHFARVEDLVKLNSTAASDFLEQHILHNPEDMVVAGAGSVGHEELCQMAEEHFGHLTQKDGLRGSTLVPSTYKGGYCDLPLLTENPELDDGNTKVALALELPGGWHDEEQLVTACVLQTLLGGGNSFSAGGPGKGMYSRLYTEVLRKYTWAESSECTVSFHTESGLFVLSGSAKPIKSEDMVSVIVAQLIQLASTKVGDVELMRAKNMLRGNVLSQLESRLVLFEDMGRQILTYGRRESNDAMCRKIDAVTADGILELVRSCLKSQPVAMAAVGKDTTKMPSYERVRDVLDEAAANV